MPGNGTKRVVGGLFLLQKSSISRSLQTQTWSDASINQTYCACSCILCLGLVSLTGRTAKQLSAKFRSKGMQAAQVSNAPVLSPLVPRHKPACRQCLAVGRWRVKRALSSCGALSSMATFTTPSAIQAATAEELRGAVRSRQQRPGQSHLIVMFTASW
jgi:hypothetical protein